ncbi:MAG: Lrp/AsnC ligand binding domain-containing protein [Methanocellales archaeon]
MAIGFVLINVEIGKDREVYERLIKNKKFKEIYFLFGEYDLIAKIEAKDFDELSDIVFNEIRTVPGVRSTKTLTGATFPRK